MILRGIDRRGKDRRKFAYTSYSPERRLNKDRRKNNDRRKD